MDTYSSGRVAVILGVAVPTVHRAVRRLDMRPDATAGGHRSVSYVEVSALTGAFGAIPVVPGFTREEVQVLAGLARSPLGLRSVRAVARRAVVSPTAADRLLGRLLAAGLVVKEQRRFVEGRVTDGCLWRIDWSSLRWPGLAPTVGRSVLPRPRARPQSARFPRRLGHLVWNADVATLDTRRHAAYLAERVMTSGDVQGLAWAATALPAESLASARRLRGLPAPARALAGNLADAR